AEILFRIVIPGILGHILTGVRLAIGIIWIMLVPCEMLGVSSGLGYFILDTRDRDRKSTRLNSSHVKISYAVFCLKKKNIEKARTLAYYYCFRSGRMSPTLMLLRLFPDYDVVPGEHRLDVFADTAFPHCTIEIAVN